MCSYAYYEECGRRSFSNYLPAYAQGEYMPGEEPGLRCKKDGQPCYQDSAVADFPEECNYQEFLQQRCPYCGKILMRNGAKVVYCPDCGIV